MPTYRVKFKHRVTVNGVVNENYQETVEVEAKDSTEAAAKVISNYDTVHDIYVDVV